MQVGASMVCSLTLMLERRSQVASIAMSGLGINGCRSNPNGPGSIDEIPDSRVFSRVIKKPACHVDLGAKCMDVLTCMRGEGAF